MIHLYLKIHQDEGKRIVALCDKDLIGKVLDDGEAYMDLDRYRRFYVGEIAEKERIIKELEEFDSINIVGKKSVGVVRDLGLVEEGSILHINDVPYVQIYKI